mmetsp:Transcript_16607/g.36830  ORF Transcript_16607/g.36830 Transcript_16607/m.36830 type:complete len:246 (+) Transcript_16607:2531-3268(+)
MGAFTSGTVLEMSFVLATMAAARLDWYRGVSNASSSCSWSGSGCSMGFKEAAGRFRDFFLDASDATPASSTSASFPSPSVASISPPSSSSATSACSSTAGSSTDSSASAPVLCSATFLPSSTAAGAALCLCLDTSTSGSVASFASLATGLAIISFVAEPYVLLLAMGLAEAASVAPFKVGVMDDAISASGLGASGFEMSSDFMQSSTSTGGSSVAIDSVSFGCPFSVLWSGLSLLFFTAFPVTSF